MSGFDQNTRNVLDMFGAQAVPQPPGAPARPPLPSPPPMPAPGVSPDVNAVAQMHAGRWDADETLERLFPGGMTPQQQAFRDSYADAQASDGMIDKAEGEALRRQANAVGTDQLSFLQSMYLRGHDPAQITALYEKLRGVDSARPGDPNASHLDQNGNPLAAASTLTPEEMHLWRETQIARFEDMQAGTPMSKTVNPGQAQDFAAGVMTDRRSGATVDANQVGGFVTMDAHVADQDAQQRLATAGLDSGYHAKPFVNFVTPDAANPAAQASWSSQVQTEGVGAVNFPMTGPMHQDARVPLGSVAMRDMQEEAQRRMSNSVTRADGTVVEEYVPELLRAESGAGGMRLDATGLPMLQHVQEMNREVSGNAVDDQANPFTGWGFSSTRRVSDAAGNPYPVVPNQELTFTRPHQMSDGYTVTQVPPTSPVQQPVAAAPAGGGPVVTDPAADARRQWAIYDQQVALGRAPAAPPRVPRV